MKNLRLLQMFVFVLCIVSCEKDDSNDDQSPLSDNPGMTATINGGTYSNYAFKDGIYQVTTNANGNTMSINAADFNGDQVTLFLNATGGFSAGAVKNMGELDDNNFTNYVTIRQQSSTQISYMSTSGNVKISQNRAHPTEAGTRLISGTFNISAASTTDENATVMTGSFTELEYQE